MDGPQIVTGFTGSIWWSPTGPRRSIARGVAMDGVVASIKWGYYTAAGIHGYRVACSKDGVWSLTATVVLSDAFKMAQTPLTFVAVRTKKGLDGICVVKAEWRWLILSYALGDGIDSPRGQLTARLGPPEET